MVQILILGPTEILEFRSKKFTPFTNIEISMKDQRFKFRMLVAFELHKISNGSVSSRWSTIEKQKEKTKQGVHIHKTL